VAPVAEGGPVQPPAIGRAPTPLIRHVDSGASEHCVSGGAAPASESLAGNPSAAVHPPTLKQHRRHSRVAAFRSHHRVFGTDDVQDRGGTDAFHLLIKEGSRVIVERLMCGAEARKSRWAFLLAASLLLIACGDSGATTGLGRTTLVQIAGTVTDAATGVPIPGAEVDFRRKNINVGTTLRVVHTDSQGRYSLSHREERCAHLFFIQVSKAGYTWATANTFMDDRPVIQCVETVQIYDFALEPQPAG
jgi:5-hydroxyisourate hydrolase-like protein (transthyretin family)